MMEKAVEQKWWFWRLRDAAREAMIPNVEITETIHGELQVRRVTSRTIKSVLNALVQYCGEDGQCRPSMVTIAEDIGASVKSVQRAIRAMVSEGIIAVVGKWFRCNVYELAIEKLEKIRREISQKVLFKRDSEDSSSDSSTEMAAEPAKHNPQPKPEIQPEPKTVIAHDGVERSAAPKFTPPGKTEHGKKTSQPEQGNANLKPVLLAKLRALGVKKLSAANKAIEIMTAREIADGLEHAEKLNAAGTLNAGAVVWWLENGSWPTSQAKTAKDSGRRWEAFKKSATQFLGMLVHENGNAIDETFLKTNWWSLYHAGQKHDAAMADFIQSCKRLNVSKVKKKS